MSLTGVFDGRHKKKTEADRQGFEDTKHIHEDSVLFESSTRINTFWRPFQSQSTFYDRGSSKEEGEPRLPCLAVPRPPLLAAQQIHIATHSIYVGQFTKREN